MPIKRNPANDRQSQQKLRDRRKECGWKRVTIWLDPDELNELKKHDSNWLGTTVKMLLKTGLSDKQQDNTINAQALSDKQAPVVIEPAPVAIDDAIEPTGAGQMVPAVEWGTIVPQLTEGGYFPDDVASLTLLEKADDPPIFVDRVKSKRIRYSDEVCVMILGMKEAGECDDAIAVAVKAKIGQDLPASFKSNIAKLVKRGRALGH